jgi:hypothetical protein
MKTYNPQTTIPWSEIDGTKGDLFANHPEPFDFALPQGWLNEFSDWCKIFRKDVTYDMIRTTVIWSYVDGVIGTPVTCCTEVLEAHKRYRKQANRMGNRVF